MRIKGLDSVRGIASLIVFLYHILTLSVPMATIYREFHYKLLFVLFNGPASVAIFFVLSGFVLTTLVTNSAPFSYFRYAARRIVRLYIPYVVAVAVSTIMLLCALSLHPQNMAHVPWGFSRNWWSPATQLTMIGMSGDESVNGPIWTLFIEMQASFLIPIYALIPKKWHILACIGMVTLANIFGAFYAMSGGQSWLVPDTMWQRVCITIYYMQYFAIGSTLCIYATEIRSAVSRTGEVGMLSLIGIVFGCLIFRAVENHLIKGLGYLVMAASLIVTCISFDRAESFLTNRIFLYLGKISFSLYLVQWPIICFCLAILVPAIGTLAAFSIATVTTFAAAELFNRLVEVPAIRLSRNLPIGPT